MSDGSVKGFGSVYLREPEQLRTGYGLGRAGVRLLFRGLRAQGFAAPLLAVTARSDADAATRGIERERTEALLSFNTLQAETFSRHAAVLKAFEAQQNEERHCVQQSVSPATAEPCVPSTWKVTRSSR